MHSDYRYPLTQPFKPVELSRLAELATTFIGLESQEFVDVLAASVTDRFDGLALLYVEIQRTRV